MVGRPQCLAAMVGSYQTIPLLTGLCVFSGSPSLRRVKREQDGGALQVNHCSVVEATPT
jgi:hypothetical protein